MQAHNVTIKETPTTPVTLANCMSPIFQNWDTESEVITDTKGLSIKNSATATEAGKA